MASVLPVKIQSIKAEKSTKAKKAQHLMTVTAYRNPVNAVK